MEKINFIGILMLFLVITLGINYFLHASIIEQDKEIREKAIDYINHFCVESTTADYGIEFVFDPNSSVGDFGVDGND